MNDLHTEPNPLRLEREATRVRVYTPSGVFEGDYHHHPGVRLSDSLRNQATGERYMLLTNVEIRRADGTPVTDGVSAAGIVLVNTQHASVIVPLDETGKD